MYFIRIFVSVRKRDIATIDRLINDKDPMMSFDIEELQSLSARGDGSLLRRVVGSIVVGMCLIIGLLRGLALRVSRGCSRIVAEVSADLCALAEEFADAVMHGVAHGRGEIAMLCPIAVSTKSLYSLSPPRRSVARSGAMALSWLNVTGPPGQIFAQYPKPPNGETLGFSSARAVQTWHHPPMSLVNKYYFFAQ